MAEYKQMQVIVPGCITLTNRYVVTKALDVARDDYNCVFECIVNLGYKPILNAEKTPKVEKRRLQKISSQTNKFDKELNTVDSSSLTKEQQQRLFSAQIKCGIQKALLSEKMNDSVKAAGAKCINSGKVKIEIGDASDIIKALKL